MEYAHKFNGVSRVYRLQNGKIHIHYGSLGGSKGEATFDLSIISEHYTHSYERSQFFNSAVLLSILLAIMAIITVGFSILGYIQHYGLVALYALIAVAFLVGSSRPTELYTFRNRDGVVLFSVTKNHKKHVEFDAFIDALLCEIRGCDLAKKS